MSPLIKIRCNGAGKHVNEVDYEKSLKPTVVMRGGPPRVADADLPERLNFPCKECTGEVIVTREMMLKHRARG